MFDFEEHRKQAAADYSRVRESHARFAAELESLLTRVLKAKQIPFHQISGRAKTVEKFSEKAAKASNKLSDTPKYKNPMVDITDMTGVRIIVLNRSALKAVDDAVRSLFSWRDRQNKGDKNLDAGTVGYESIHYLVQFDPVRASQPENSEFAALTAEIQIRTILQHAWAEIEHDIRYKSKDDPNNLLSQRFTALAGLVNIGDREFDEIYQIDEARRKNVRESAQIAEETLDGSAQITRKESKAAVAASIAALTSAPDHESASSPRLLIAKRNYPEAIRSYTKLILAEPTQFAHYLGRARARFLDGDGRGALEDLARSDELSPNNPLSATVRSLITGEAAPEVRDDPNLTGSSETSEAYAEAAEGDRADQQEQQWQDPRQETYSGHQALARGDATSALMHYLRAERLGYNPVYAVFNRAMARCLEKRYGLCLKTLEQLHPFPGSVLEFHVKMLQGICILAEGGNVTNVLPVIAGNRKALADTVGYDYSRSVLQHLEPALEKQEDVWKKVCGVFKSAKRFDSPPQ